MSDVMLHGILRMPFEMAMNDIVSRYQFYQTAQQALDRMVIAEEQVEKLLNHCPDSECDTCAEIICPHGCAWHFHHDGCPTCAEHEAERLMKIKEEQEK
jgi:G:T-mismatch repair DNA endonuclease (very short patch repair protein)